MSETGSGMLIMSGDVLSPTRLAPPGDLSLEREFAEAEAAQPELPEICPSAPAALATVVLPHRELGRPLLFLDPRLLSHVDCSRIWSSPQRAQRRGLKSP